MLLKKCNIGLGKKIQKKFGVGSTLFKGWKKPNGYQSCGRFGGEGTGAKILIRFDKWKLGNEYSFLTTAKPVPNDRVQYTGYMYAKELDGWNMIGMMIGIFCDMRWRVQETCRRYVPWRTCSRRVGRLHVHTKERSDGWNMIAVDVGSRGGGRGVKGFEELEKLVRGVFG